MVVGVELVDFPVAAALAFVVDVEGREAGESTADRFVEWLLARRFRELQVSG